MYSARLPFAKEKLQQTSNFWCKEEMCLRFCSLFLNYIDILLVHTCNLHHPLLCTRIKYMQDKCQNIMLKNCDLSLQMQLQLQRLFFCIVLPHAFLFVNYHSRGPTIITRLGKHTTIAFAIVSQIDRSIQMNSVMPHLPFLFTFVRIIFTFALHYCIFARFFSLKFCDFQLTFLRKFP